MEAKEAAARGFSNASGETYLEAAWSGSGSSRAGGGAEKVVDLVRRVV